MKNKYINIIIIFLLIQSLLDISVVVIPIFPLSIIIRGLFFLLMSFYLIKNFKKKYIPVFLSLLVLLLYNYFYLKYGIFNTLSNVLKLFYLIFSILLFSNLKKDKNTDKVLLISLYLYLSIFIISYIFKLGNYLYVNGEGKTGFSGLFNSINEFSAIVIFLYYYLFNYLKKIKIINILTPILILLASLISGTKVLLGGLFLILFINIIIFITKNSKINNKKKIIVFVSFFVITILGIYLFTYTSVFKNMIVQGNFFKVKNIFSLDFINIVLFNNRITFLNINFNYYINSNIICKLLGIGYFNTLKLVELDIFDILFRYGIIGLLILIYTVSIKFKNIINNKNIIGFIILILISLTSGHILLAPSVSIYFGFLFMKRDD